MYSLFGQSESLPSSGGVAEDALVFDEGSSVIPQELHTLNQHHNNHHHLHYHHHHHNNIHHDHQHESLQHHYHQNGQPNSEEDSSIAIREHDVLQQGHCQEPISVQQRVVANQEIADFEDFLYCRAGTSRDMVAQDMPQSYDQLFQEPQQFITLEELGPLLAHQQDHRSQTHRVSTSNTSAHLYPGNYSQCSATHQQRTYYNLSSPTQESSCTLGYFGNAGESSMTGDIVTSVSAQEDLPLTVLTPSQTSSSRSSNTNNNNNNKILGVTKSDSNSSNSNDREIKKQKIEKPDEAIIAEMAPRFDENKSSILPEQGSSSNYHHNDNQIRHNYHHHHHHHHRRRHDDSEVEATSSHGTTFEQPDDLPSLPKKQKNSSHDDNEVPAEETGEDVKSTRTSTDNKKQNHSEIEKRRRDKMNTYITELSTMVPMCNAMSRKLDKLTVLRMAVQHLKTILGSTTSYTEGHYKPSFLSDQELKTLILQAAEGFVFVVGCDRGRILYVSESVSKTLNYTQEDLLGQSWFDILHPKDVAKVKEQLSSSDLSPRERLIDAKTMLPLKADVPQEVTRLCPGARRSFFCRMKRKLEVSDSQVKEESESSSSRHRRRKQQNVDWKYCVIHCTGYLKSWAPAKSSIEERKRDTDVDGEGCNLSCLVAVGRVQPELPDLSAPGPSIPRVRPMEFVSRHAIDGKFLFVDQRATLVLGFLPQELQGTSMYEYYHHDDIPHLADCHKTALRSPERVMTRIYRFRTKGSSFVNLQSEWKSFRNPWTKDIDYLISKNFTVYCDTRRETQTIPEEDCNLPETYNYFTQSNGELERIISSHVEKSKIGRKIAEDVLDHNQRRSEDSCSISSPNPAPDRTTLNTEFQVSTAASPDERVRNIVEVAEVSETNSSVPTTMYNNQIRNNVQLSGIGTDITGVQSDEDMMEMISNTALSESVIPLPSDGNDEAAMAVIMSLLEADAGLGGPVDFSGLPWPLP